VSPQAQHAPGRSAAALRIQIHRSVSVRLRSTLLKCTLIAVAVGVIRTPPLHVAAHLSDLHIARPSSPRPQHASEQPPITRANARQATPTNAAIRACRTRPLRHRSRGDTDEATTPPWTLGPPRMTAALPRATDTRHVPPAHALMTWSSAHPDTTTQHVPRARDLSQSWASHAASAS